MPALIHGPHDDGKCVGITGASEALGSWREAILCSIVELPSPGRAIYYLDLDFYNTEFKFVFLPILPTQSAGHRVEFHQKSVIWEEGNNLQIPPNEWSLIGFHFFDFRTIEKKNLLGKLSSIKDYIFGSGDSSRWIFSMVKIALVRSCEKQPLSRSWDFLVKSLSRCANSRHLKDNFTEILQTCITELVADQLLSPEHLVKILFSSRHFYGPRFPSFMEDVLLKHPVLFSDLILQLSHDLPEPNDVKLSVDRLGENNMKYFGVLRLLLVPNAYHSKRDADDVLNNLLMFLNNQLPPFTQRTLTTILRKYTARDLDHLVNPMWETFQPHSNLYPDLVEFYGKAMIGYLENAFWKQGVFGYRDCDNLIQSKLFKTLLSRIKDNQDISTCVNTMETNVMQCFYRIGNLERLVPHLVFLPYLPWIDDLACYTLESHRRIPPRVTMDLLQYAEKLEGYPKFHKLLHSLILRFTTDLIRENRIYSINDQSWLFDALLELYKTSQFDLLKSPSIQAYYQLGLSSTKQMLPQVNKWLLETGELFLARPAIQVKGKPFVDHLANLRGIVKTLSEDLFTKQEALLIHNNHSAFNMLHDFGLSRQVFSKIRKSVADLKVYQKAFEKFQEFNRKARIVDPQHLDTYLAIITLDTQSTEYSFTQAKSEVPPIKMSLINWFNKVSDSALFSICIVRPPLEQDQDRFPLPIDDAEQFLISIAGHWETLAMDIKDGQVPFDRMEELMRRGLEMQLEQGILSHNHRSGGIYDVTQSVSDFTVLRSIKDHLAGFFRALSYFTIVDRQLINHLTETAADLEKNWLTSNLKIVREQNLLQTFKQNFGVDHDIELVVRTMEFIASLVRKQEDGSYDGSLITWLKSKSEDEMNNYVKVLTGSSMEAFFMLQTLRTRTISFLNKSHVNLSKLLVAVIEAEKTFGKQRGSSRKIDTVWLFDKFPDIDTALKELAVSPSESAKRHATALSSLHVSTSYSGPVLRVKLKSPVGVPNEVLGLEELKQDLQLLEMSKDDSIEQSIGEANAINEGLTMIGVILEIWDLFVKLFEAGHTHFTQPKEELIHCALDRLVAKKQTLRIQLSDWENLWIQLKNYPLLARFPRDHLFYLAELVRTKQVQELTNRITMFLWKIPVDLDSYLHGLVDKYSERLQKANEHSSIECFKDLYAEFHDGLLIQSKHSCSESNLIIPESIREFGHYLQSLFLKQVIQLAICGEEEIINAGLCAHIALTKTTPDPAHFLVASAETTDIEIERFLSLWRHGDQREFFSIVHVESLNPNAVRVVKKCIPYYEDLSSRPKLLLLAVDNRQLKTDSTKALGALLGLSVDVKLEYGVPIKDVRTIIVRQLPVSSRIRCFTSTYPGCGKTSQIQLWANGINECLYYRIPIRCASVEDILKLLRQTMIQSALETQANPILLHFDIGFSTGVEFRTILLSLLLQQGIFDPFHANLGVWSVRDSNQVFIAVEFASPFGLKQFPVIGLFDHIIVACDPEALHYDRPVINNGRVTIEPNYSLKVTTWFLQQYSLGDFAPWEQARLEQLNYYDDLSLAWAFFLWNCEPLVSNEQAFQLFQQYLTGSAYQTGLSFSSFSMLAGCITNSIRGLFTQHLDLFENAQLDSLFRQNMFDLVFATARATVFRSTYFNRSSGEINCVPWESKTPTLLTVESHAMNVFGTNEQTLKENTFHQSIRPFIEAQGIKLFTLCGNSAMSQEQTQLLKGAIRAMIILDDPEIFDETRVREAYERCKNPDYVITADNLIKMLVTLSRIKYKLPVIIFGEAGVGKTALFKFLIETILNYTFEVCNVHSGTTCAEIEQKVHDVLNQIQRTLPKKKAFIFFDEFNTADPCVISFFKELMIDRHCNGWPLDSELCFLAAANPYRKQPESSDDIGLLFQYGGHQKSEASELRQLVYRVNQIPFSLYEYIHDYGTLHRDAVKLYLQNFCNHKLGPEDGSKFAEILIRCHEETQCRSADRLSAVSLRDAVRAIALKRWFLSTYPGPVLSKNGYASSHLAVYLCYAFRFLDTQRKDFLQAVFGREADYAITAMKDATRLLMDRLYKPGSSRTSIGAGAIALNEALCENVFASFVCVLNSIFTIIVGKPGTSKSLSIEILKNALSTDQHMLRKELAGPNQPPLKALAGGLYFQCSPLSTSAGFKALFDSARKLSSETSLIQPLVVLDELGLADLSPDRPIKVLHSELERASNNPTENISVIALSNWVVDAAQVNRGILIRRTNATKEDLSKSAWAVTESLLDKACIKNSSKLKKYISVIVSVYERLFQCDEVGGVHMFSMRDFFFTVKNFVVYASDLIRSSKPKSLKDPLISAIIRNFTGHPRALSKVQEILREENLQFSPPSPLDLICQNISDSTHPYSVHIARHQMLMSKSLQSLHLLMNYVKPTFSNQESNHPIEWNVLFGSLFPGDSKLLSITRKLRQVEQAIRQGGVLILCHAEQIFESLYIVLNQQYWTQGNVTMTHIALGPTTRAIALPEGHFRIIVCVDSDKALSKQSMSPAVLSRFEKRQISAKDFLNEQGKRYLRNLKYNPFWQMCRTGIISAHKLIYGYHNDLLPSIALFLQSQSYATDLGVSDDTAVDLIWLKVASPMSVILARSRDCDYEIDQLFEQYKKHCIYDNFCQLISSDTSQKLVVITHTLRHAEIIPESMRDQCESISMFEFDTEYEFQRGLDKLFEHLDDPNKILIVRHDVTSSPIEIFQFAKYEINSRLKSRSFACKIVLVVHVDTCPENNKWSFTLGDSWEYVFVDDIAPIASHRLSLRTLLEHTAPADFFERMTLQQFQSVLLELLGPALMIQHVTLLGSAIGKFFTNIRKLCFSGQENNLLRTLQKCIIYSLRSAEVAWNPLEEVKMPSFDSNSQLSHSLWRAFLHRVAGPIAKFLIVTDVWRITPTHVETIQIWLDFMMNQVHVQHRLHYDINQLPPGYLIAKQPFGRLFSGFGEGTLSDALSQLFNILSNNDGSAKYSTEIRTEYFRDWLLLHTPGYLHHVIETLPFRSIISKQINDLFEPDTRHEFISDWKQYKLEILSALELLSLLPEDSLVELATVDYWKSLAPKTASLVLRYLSHSKDPVQIVKCLSCIEANPSLIKMMFQQLSCTPKDFNRWITLLIRKRVITFCESSGSVEVSSSWNPDLEKGNLVHYITQYVIRNVLQVDLPEHDTATLLQAATECYTFNDFYECLLWCNTDSRPLLYIRKNERIKLEDCPQCGQPLPKQHKLVDDPNLAPEQVVELLEPQSQPLEFHSNLEPSSAKQWYNAFSQFQLLFEQISLFLISITNSHNLPKKILCRFFFELFGINSQVKLSSRFFTSIVRQLFHPGTMKLIDFMVSNGTMPEQFSSSNTESFLSGLLYYLEQSPLQENEATILDHLQRISEIALTPKWNLQRIALLRSIRAGLTASDFPEPVRENIIKTALMCWNTTCHEVLPIELSEPILVFILRFVCSGNERVLSKVLDSTDIPESIKSHSMLEDHYSKSSPAAIRIPILVEGPLGERYLKFDSELCKQTPDLSKWFGASLFHQFDPDYGFFLARLALHCQYVAAKENIDILRCFSSEEAATYYLPGVSGHPVKALLRSNDSELFFWYVCSCGVLNNVGNCGNVIDESVCHKCHVKLAQSYHVMRSSVRKATENDFKDPVGLAVEMNAEEPQYSVLDSDPLTTRVAILLVCLSIVGEIVQDTLSEFHANNLLKTTLFAGSSDSPMKDLVKFLCSTIQTHLRVLGQIVFQHQTNSRLEEIQLMHLILNKLPEAIQENPRTLSALTRSAHEYRHPTARLEFLQQLSELLSAIDPQQAFGNLQTTQFDQLSLYHWLPNNRISWAYQIPKTYSRRTVQMILAKHTLDARFKYVSFALDPRISQRMDLLSDLPNAMRFVGLARDVFQYRYTEEQLSQWSIADGLNLLRVAVVESDYLDRGTLITPDDVDRLFACLVRLWNGFSQLSNAFLSRFDCQVLDQTQFLLDWRNA